MRPTYLCIEDIDDVPNPPCDVEGMQEEGMKSALGLPLWTELEDRENETV